MEKWERFWELAANGALGCSLQRSIWNIPLQAWPEVQNLVRIMIGGSLGPRSIERLVLANEFAEDIRVILRGALEFRTMSEEEILAVQEILPVAEALILIIRRGVVRFLLQEHSSSEI